MRETIPLQDDWRFTKRDAGLPAALPEDWERVTLPHTWNGVDGQGGAEDYYRGGCWYARAFPTPRQPLGGGRVYVEILAAGQQAEVYVNGQRAASHQGGYSAFRADVTGLCRETGENLLAVYCSNAYKDGVYPQTADFTFYGGLYRGVNLICVPETHFDLDTYGGPGVKATPRPVEGGAVFALESFVTNPGPDYTVLYSVLDGEDREAAAGTRPSDSTAIELFVPEARLWSVDEPYLYTVTATLQRRNEAVDAVSVRAGVRSFRVDPQRGFSLNGVPTPLRGVSRHQDRLYKGNALSAADHYEDAGIIKELGANAVRLAHYQHSQDFYDACDELGLVVWAEIPFISVFDPDPAAHRNCLRQLTELIVQNYNHPSICFWGLANEITIGGMDDRIPENLRELNGLAKRLDPTRLTTLAHLSNVPVDSVMHGIPDVIAYNHYMGWYGGRVEDNGPWLDAFHAARPELCLGLSEYGCEGIITYHGPEPKCKDYSEEYQALYHEHMARVIAERPWLWCSFVWNMFDFGAANRDEGGVRGRNNKGLVTLDRRIKKDAYYIYKAYWNPEPMVHICGRRYAQRAGETTVVKFYTNEPETALYVNNDLVWRPTARPGQRVFAYRVKLRPGQNWITVRTPRAADSTTLERVETEPPVYALPDAQERAKFSGNWFEKLDESERAGALEFPAGRYSVRDTYETLCADPAAFAVINKYMKLATNFPLTPGAGNWKQIHDKSPEQLRDRLPEGFLQVVNRELNKIEKA